VLSDLDLPNFIDQSGIGPDQQLRVVVCNFSHTD
jgi:hypothetical protein